MLEPALGRDEQATEGFVNKVTSVIIEGYRTICFATVSGYSMEAASYLIAHGPVEDDNRLAPIILAR